MNELPPLLADGLEDVIGFVVFLVVAIVIWGIQAFGKMVQQGRPQRPKGAGAPRPAQGGGLEDEIGQFLRNAARRREQQQRPGPQAPPPRRPAEKPVIAEVVGGQRPDRAQVLREQARQAARRQAQAAPVARSSPQYGAPRAEPQRLAKRSATPREKPPTPPLPLQPEAEAPRVELPSVFSALAKPGPAPDVASAAGLYAMLSKPGGLRQAIVLMEVLNRPEDRW